MNTTVMFSSKSNEWATPQDFYDKLDSEFNFTLDPAADDHNHKCPKYYTKEIDGLIQSWAGEKVFCNPPYGREIGTWVKKCHDEVFHGGCQLAVMLIPARTDTRYFHEWIYGKAEIRFLRGG